jgi:hypothetical protein
MGIPGLCEEVITKKHPPKLFETAEAQRRMD